ncbi:MAG: hypothetical protein HEQ39_00435 [Rhizobacter sp.]
MSLDFDSLRFWNVVTHQIRSLGCPAQLLPGCGDADRDGLARRFCSQAKAIGKEHNVADMAFEAKKVSIHAVLRGIEERLGETCGQMSRLMNNAI